MMRLLARLWVLLALLAAPAAAAPVGAGPVDSGRVVAELVPQVTSLSPGQSAYVALRLRMDDGWHTYWRNSGDSGAPTELAWTLPKGFAAGEIVWPTPHRQPTGPLVNYGYTGEVLLLVPITAPADARPGETARLAATAQYLVCEEICVPEAADLTLDLPITAAPGAPHPTWGAPIARALAAAPKPAGLTARIAAESGALKLAVTGPALHGADMAGAYFYPFKGGAVNPAGPQGVERGPEGLTLTLPPADPKAVTAAPLAGVLALPGGAYEIAAEPGPPPPGAAGLGPPPRAAGEGAAGLGLPLAVAFAVLGGLILNLMPCVFPILAMKAAGLAGHAHEQAAARRHALAFLVGVLATFLALAGALIAFKAAGAAVGWGFQLQSPPVVAALALVMLAVALNLSGVFEVGGSLQNVGGGLASRRGLAGSLFTGALAVVVAAPCTAPFMAPALGWALTQSAPATLAVFLALGLGFAAPFVAASYAPALLRRLPRPGPWMDALRRLLAFPMYGAAAWLVWVLTVQAGDLALARILAAGVVLALAAWLAGRAQRRQALGGASPLVPAVTAGLLAALALAAALWPGYAAQTAATTTARAEGVAAPYEPYSPQRLAALQAEGRPVFVNYTAAWCVTCQVNEQVALSTGAVAEALKRTGAVYLKADWTLKDAAIAKDLAAHGRAGVPLYLVYGKAGGAPKVLPQLLSDGMVVEALEAAARG